MGEVGGAHHAVDGASEESLLRGFGRAVGGALLFAVPVMMTQEIWRFAHTASRLRLALLVVLGTALVVALCRTFGTGQPGFGARAYVTDAGVAFVAAALTTGLVLVALGVIRPLHDWREVFATVGLEVLPAAIGASFARSQLGAGARGPRASGYGHELFLMIAGAVVLSASIAPTREVVLLAVRTRAVGAVAVVVLSLGVMHGFVYLLGFKGQPKDDRSAVRTFATLTVVGYTLALGVAALLLWTFGRLDGLGAAPAASEIVVLGLPASLGAAAARLVL